MKVRLLAFTFLLFLPTQAFPVEMIQGVPQRKYEIITPISSDKRKIEKAFQDIQKKAEKIGADAIIQWECAAGQRESGLLGGGVFAKRTRSVCQGIAIKWKN